MATPVYVADSNEMPDRQESRGAPREGNRKHTYIMALSANDVLCGRGSGPNDHEGNIRFRQLVLSRKAEYLSTNARQTKSRIAQEIVYHVKFRVNPQGRFLKKLEADTLQCSHPYSTSKVPSCQGQGPIISFRHNFTKKYFFSKVRLVSDSARSDLPKEPIKS